jgi:Putative beta barrel porin-7 (BBP7)
VRPGDQLSPFVNSKAIPSSPNFQAPQAVEPNTRVFQTSDYWAQGLNFSVNFKF